MALTKWKGNIVRKQDILISKNYLNHNELDSLNRFVTVFLETAELRAKDEKDISISFWQENVDKIIEFNNKKLLGHKGNISSKKMTKKVSEIYEKFNDKRKKEEIILADKQDMKELESLEADIKKLASK